MLHIPILRHGKPYESIDKVEIVHHATGEPVAKVSQANAGLISRDVNRMDYDVLEQFKVRELIDMCRKAAEVFLTGTVAGWRSGAVVRRLRPAALEHDGHAVRVLPHERQEDPPHARRDRGDPRGLTRGFDLSILDRGFGDDDGRCCRGSARRARSARCCPATRPACTRCGSPPSR
jgi:hypothetical protein